MRFIYTLLILALLTPPDPVMVTARATVRICEQYRPIVESWLPEFDLDPDLVLAVMAKESGCAPNATDGLSYGLMQIVPRPWTLSETYLKQPKWNIWQGMWFLDTIYNSEQNDGTWHRALAAYNCGWTSLDAGKCIPVGGPRYADSILGFWLPLVKEMRAETVCGGKRLGGVQQY